VADLRSSIARGWISYFAERGHEVHVLSTYPCRAEGLRDVEVHLLTGDAERGSFWAARKVGWSRYLDPATTAGRMAGWLHDNVAQPAKAWRLAARARRLVEAIRPELLHSLRIPIEGEVGSGLGMSPHVVSAWGNDFTLYADRSVVHAAWTRRVLTRCEGFLADARADIQRARRYGLREKVPTAVLPGAGGVRRELFHPAAGSPPVPSAEMARIDAWLAGRRMVLNPRGFRRYVRNDLYFEAVRRIHERHGDVAFVGVGLRGWKPIEEQVRGLGLERCTYLTSSLATEEMAALYQRAEVSVSPTVHDGTPNTLLEAMACGCVPVCGDLPSIREWIAPGENGLLCRLEGPEALTQAMEQALEDRELGERARARNPEIIRERADYGTSMARAEQFYGALLGRAAEARPVLAEVAS
jgi:glycosyltransferase involved in cell wall biosynthesis